MQVRIARGADLAQCLALDHSYDTEYVWQMQTYAGADRVEAAFQRSRLPRPVTVCAPPNERWLRENWERQDCFLVAEHMGHVLGYVDMTVRAWQLTGWVNHLGVGRNYRRHGIGTALLKAARLWAEQQDLRVLIAETQPKNHPAIQLCRQLGFHFCGYNEQYYSNEDIALLFAWRLR